MTRDSRDVLTRPAPPPDATHAYGAHPDQVIDLRLPGTDCPSALVVLLHGGFWRPEWDRAHVGPMAADLASRGHPVAVVEYRRHGWPVLFDDIRVGVTHATTLRRTDGVILAGHSAGGQLALWFATERPDLVTGVLALAPVADLTAAHALDLDGGAVRDLLDGSPTEQPDRYAAIDPLRRDVLVRTEIVHGDQDAQVPLALGERFAEGRSVPLTKVPGADHFALIDPLSAAWPAVVSALARLT